MNCFRPSIAPFPVEPSERAVAALLELFLPEDRRNTRLRFSHSASQQSTRLFRRPVGIDLLAAEPMTSPKSW